MPSYSALLTKRPGIFASQMVELPSSIQLTPKRWSATDIGGPKAATIDAVGSPENLAYLLTWLGDRAVIYNEFSTPVWWGVIYEIEAVLGGITVSLSLESVYNRIAVLYSQVMPDGSTRAAKTAWAADTDSINRYGQRELLYSLQESTDATATAVRDRLLEQFADPAPIIAVAGGSEYVATLHCRGNWETLEFMYYTNDRGLVAYEGGGDEQIIGASYTANTISFSTPNDVADSANGFAPLVAGTDIHIAGAANSDNNGDFTVDSLEDSGALNVNGETLVDEAAGNNITISIGHGPEIGWIAQSFTLPSSSGWTAHKIALRVMRMGNPSDNLDFRIRADNAGEPGATLAQAQTAGINIPTAMNWIEMTLGSPLFLNTATTYWVQVGRTGAPSLTDYYIVDLDEGLGYGDGSLKVFTGSMVAPGAWQLRDPDADMPFRIVGQVDSMAQATDALERSPEFLSVLPALSSGVMVDSYVDIERTLLEQVQEIIELGTSTGERLVAHVTHGRDVIIETVPENGDANPVLGRDGRLRHANGAPWEPGVLLAGNYIHVESLPVLDGLVRTRGRRGIYVRESEYDATTEWLMIQSEGALDPWRVIQLRKG